MVEQTITHYTADGWLLHTSDHDAKRQMDMDRMEQEAATKYQTDVSVGHRRRGMLKNFWTKSHIASLSNCVMSHCVSHLSEQ